MSQNDLAQLFNDECTRRFEDEFLPRILKCLDELSDEEIWQRPNEETVSVGNLILHLCGNVTQWIISALGGDTDERQRQKEFDTMGPIPKAELISQLTNTVQRACEIIQQVNADTLVRVHAVQDSQETGMGIILQVVEHFSYHTGQISLHTKLNKNIDLEFFKDYDLDQTTGDPH